MIQNIIEEETVWANEANALRERKEIIAKIIVIIINVLGLLTTILFIFKIFKYIKILKETKKIVPEQKIEYYREIPNENSTPAEAAFLYYFKMGMQKAIPKIISATLLDLCYKKYISFNIEEKSFKRKDIIINILNSKNVQELKEDEKLIYEMLLKIKSEGSFSIKDFKKYITEHSSTILLDFERIKKAAKKEQETNKNYDILVAKKGSKWIMKMTLYGFSSILTYIWSAIIFLTLSEVVSNNMNLLAFLLSAPNIINAGLCFKIANRFNGLTQEGVNEQEKWKALKRYMENFSMLDDKEIPALLIWEKYLIYATVFGISDKVLEQLKIKFPEIDTGDLLRDTAYMHLIYSNGMNVDFIGSINSSISSGYSSANYSSGRRPEAVDSQVEEAGGGGGRWPEDGR